MRKLALTLPSFRATWSSFFGRQKQRIVRISEISTDDDDDGCHDGDDDNIDEIMTNLTKQHTLLSKNLLSLGPITL